jgi:hypothetical protein
MNVYFVRGTIHVVSMFGVQKVVGDIIKNNAIVMTTTDKVLTTAGSLVLGSMIGQQASKHFTEVTDNLISFFEKKDDDAATE